MQKDWIAILTGTTSNDKFNQFTHEVETVLDAVKTVRISAKRQYVEPWMTRGLEKSANTKHRLHKKTLKPDCTKADLDKYKTHRNAYNKLKRDL